MYLTAETLTPENRDKRIGKSLYRIVRNYDTPPHRWGILEIYNQWEIACYACWCANLSAVLEVFNAINEEQAFSRDFFTPPNKKKYPRFLKEGMS